MSKTNEKIKDREYRGHILYESGLFTREEVEKIDRSFFRGEIPVGDIVDFHTAILHLRQKEVLLAKIEKQKVIPKQGSVQLGGYRFRKKVKHVQRSIQK